MLTNLLLLKSPPHITPPFTCSSAETQKPGEKKNEENKESMLVKMLTVIKDRVVAEIRTRDKPHVRMLAALLRMDDPPGM